MRTEENAVGDFDESLAHVVVEGHSCPHIL